MALEAGLAALAAAGANAVVTAMATDAWEAVRSGFARLLGRGQPQSTATVERQLEELRAQLERLEGEARDRAIADQQAAWSTALGGLLREEPQAKEVLSALLATAAAAAPAQPVASVTQYATATGDAQQVVMGSGTQSVTFGSRHR